jgi:hypothetical protein
VCIECGVGGVVQKFWHWLKYRNKFLSDDSAENVTISLVYLLSN